MVTDAREPKRNYKIPSTDNTVDEDFTRLIDALTAIGVDVDGLLTSVAGKAALVHVHALSDVTGLVSALAGKVDTSHVYNLDDLGDVASAGATNLQALIFNGTAWVPGAVDIDNVADVTATGNAIVKAASKAAARVAVGMVDRTAHGDSNYGIQATDRVIGLNAAFTLPRTFTLPLANSVNAGDSIDIVDEVGAISTSNYLHLVRSGTTDTINGGTSYDVIMTRGVTRLISDGAGKWTVQLAGGSVLSLNNDIYVVKAGATLNLDKVTSGSAGGKVSGLTGGVLRWTLTLGNSTAETGSNAGSDFTLGRWDDTGVFIDFPITVTRSTGAVALTGALTLNSAGTPQINLNKAAGVNNNQVVGKVGGVARWFTRMGNAATETGTGNTGSDWDLVRCQDNGTPIDVPVVVSRSTGIVTFAYGPSVAGSAIYYGGNFLPMNRNYIINGGMEVSQRGTTFSNPVSGTYTLDRWIVGYDGTIGSFNILQDVWSPGGPGGGRERKNCLTWQQVTAGSGSTFRQVGQRIKGVKTLAGQQVTVSFYAQADAARTITANLVQAFGSGGSPSANVTTSVGSFNLTTGVARYTATVTLPDLTGKTLGSNGDDTLQLMFSLPLNVTMVIKVWDVQLELGPAATEFERKSFEQELRDCLPYYEKSFNYATVPAQNAGALGCAVVTSPVGASASAIGVFPVRFAARKRSASPTITLYNPAAANAQARNFTLGTDCSSTSVNAGATGETGFSVNATTPASTVAGHNLGLHWTAEAEL